jgi:hypothetical protein
MDSACVMYISEILMEENASWNKLWLILLHEITYVVLISINQKKGKEENACHFENVSWLHIQASNRI